MKYLAIAWLAIIVAHVTLVSLLGSSSVLTAAMCVVAWYLGGLASDAAREERP